MNIGIVTTWFPSGGGYVSKAYRKVLEKEHNVFIYARGGHVMKGDPIWDDEKVTWGPYHYNAIKVRHFLNWIKKKKIDILFFNEQRYWKPVMEAKRVGVIVGAYVDYYKQSTVKAFQIYDFLICNTKRHYSVFQWHKNVFYVPWGTDVSSSKNIKRPDRKLTFLISSGWQGAFTGDRRGSLLAIEAFTKVVGDCKLLVFSQVELNKCLPIWKEKIHSDPRISFVFGTFDPFPYTLGDVFLYPSKLDGIGLTLPEALSSGLPAITTNNAPMNEFVIDGVKMVITGLKVFVLFNH
jgi:1,2-diacylglycerol 3-alpha-glucosyltransferase